jgi:hypothetical protein
MITDVALQHQTVFRLGAGGPMLRFDVGALEQRCTATIETINGDMIDMLAVDESRKQQEVDQITGNALFRELQERSKRMRKDKTKPPKAT